MKKFLVIIIGALFFVPFGVNAAAPNIEFAYNCNPSLVNPGAEVICTVNATTAGYISKYKATISVSDNMTFVEATAGTGWQGGPSNGVIDLTAATAKTGSFQVMTFKVRMNSNSTVGGKVYIKNISYTSNTNETGTPTDYEKEIGLATGSTVVDVTENPDTGSYASYIVIASVAVLAIVVYLAATKRNKLYRI